LAGDERDQQPHGLKGVPTVEPVFQLPATWITDMERKNAEVNGFTVVDAASVLVTHLSEIVKRNCHEILTRQDVQNLLDNLKDDASDGRQRVHSEFAHGWPGAARFAEFVGRGNFHSQSRGHSRKSRRLRAHHEKSG
jgi:hypothetical protein